MVVPPFHTPKWSFLVGKPMVVGYHHFRKHPYDTTGCCFLLLTQQPGNSETLKPQSSVGKKLDLNVFSFQPQSLKTNRNPPLKMHGDSKFGISLSRLSIFRCKLFVSGRCISSTSRTGHQTHRGEPRRNWNKNPTAITKKQYGNVIRCSM